MKTTFFLVLFSFLIILPGCQSKPGPTERIAVVMKKYTIQPSEIRVKSGETVELDVSTADVQHGLSIPDLGIKEAVQPGKPATVRFTAPAKGEYRVACGIICGPHHDDMTAKLIVE